MQRNSIGNYLWVTSFGKDGLFEVFCKARRKIYSFLIIHNYLWSGTYVRTLKTVQGNVKFLNSGEEKFTSEAKLENDGVKRLETTNT